MTLDKDGANEATCTRGPPTLPAPAHWGLPGPEPTVPGPCWLPCPRELTLWSLLVQARQPRHGTLQGWGKEPRAKAARCSLGSVSLPSPPPQPRLPTLSPCDLSPAGSWRVWKVPTPASKPAGTEAPVCLSAPVCVHRPGYTHPAVCIAGSVKTHTQEPSCGNGGGVRRRRAGQPGFLRWAPLLRHPKEQRAWPRGTWGEPAIQGGRIPYL